MTDTTIHQYPQRVFLARLKHPLFWWWHIPVYDGVYYTPLNRFSLVDISAAGIVAVPKSSALEPSRQELSEDVSFGIGTLLVAEQSSLENYPRGGV